MKVLIVEDDPQLVDALSKGLQAEGSIVVDVPTGEAGLRQATENTFDVVIVDAVLPGISGYEVVQRLRTRAVWVSVLMLAADIDPFEEARALDLGADDVLRKPFSFDVLTARLRALVRRGASERPVVLTAGTLSLDPARRVVERESTVIDLTPLEYALLEYLMRNKDVAVTKTELLQNVWAPLHQPGRNTVESYVGYLRRKVDIPFGTNSIQTIRAVGYRLDSAERDDRPRRRTHRRKAVR